MTTKSIQEIINESGYPLQIKLENIINSSTQELNWRVLAREHRWVNAATGEEGFIDLVLDHRTYSAKFVIECKRVIGSWTFLIPNPSQYLARKYRLYHVSYASSDFSWTEIDAVPESHESAFCVMEVDGKRDSRTLEKISGELLLSLEHLAYEEANLYQEMNKGLDSQSQQRLHQRQTNMYYLPIIVTTANLQTCIFDPVNVSLIDGKISSSKIEQISFIRFRKNLATSHKSNNLNIADIREANRENDRIIFVVTAEGLIDFLTRIGTDW